MAHQGGLVTLPDRADVEGPDAASLAASPVFLDFTSEFPALYRRAYQVAFRILGQQPNAQDVAQEALARAYLRWSKVCDHATPWIVTVALNLALDQHRARERDHRRHRELVVLHEEAKTDFASDQRADLVRALRNLSRRQRQVVVLRYLGDLSETDTAAELGISVGAVKSHASRGLAALRASLNTRDEE
jgi:RNA polymerase sigma-70 factor (sigma-E family)